MAYPASYLQVPLVPAAYPASFPQVPLVPVAFQVSYLQVPWVWAHPEVAFLGDHTAYQGVEACLDEEVLVAYQDACEAHNACNWVACVVGGDQLDYEDVEELDRWDHSDCLLEDHEEVPVVEDHEVREDHELELDQVQGLQVEHQ